MTPESSEPKYNPLEGFSVGELRDMWDEADEDNVTNRTRDGVAKGDIWAELDRKSKEPVVGGAGEQAILEPDVQQQRVFQPHLSEIGILQSISRIQPVQGRLFSDLVVRVREAKGNIVDLVKYRRGRMKLVGDER